MSDGEVISVVETDRGSFNLIGIEGDGFVLTGNLSRLQLVELQQKIMEALNPKAARA